jgi:hypothetical protein
MQIVHASSGALIGEYDGAEAEEARKAMVTKWDADENEALPSFAASFVKSASGFLFQKVEWCAWPIPAHGACLCGFR